jgi:cytochrome c
MDGRFNTIAGWVLGAGIVLLGATLVTGEFFKAERPETMGYAIPGVEAEAGEGGAAAEAPIAHYLQTADAARGEAVFRRCQSCHNVDNGGANGLGPNLWGTAGNNVAHRPDFSYSDALKNHGGRWDWDTLSAWLHSPSRFAPGTKMTFAGLSNSQDRANVIAFLNSKSDSPQPRFRRQTHSQRTHWRPPRCHRRHCLRPERRLRRAAAEWSKCRHAD